MKNVLRRCRFTPYRKGMGPTFRLTTWDTGRYCDNKPTIGYKLTMYQGGKPTILFEGEDFYLSPLRAIDSDDSIKTLMFFLTLRPGDTDDEYFAEYTPAQLEYCQQYAEALSCEICSRFGEE